MSKRPRVAPDESPLVSNPFAALKLDGAPDAPAEEGEPKGAATSQEPAPVSVGQRLIVRRQKKGHGGKTVTYVEGLDAGAADAWIRALKQELGCSGRHEGETLILGTSDHQRVARWLQDAGATSVKLGN